MTRYSNPSKTVHMEHADALYEKYRKGRDAFYRAYDSGEFEPVIILDMLLTLAMLRVEMRNLDGMYRVGPLSEDLDDINKKYKSIRKYVSDHMQRVVPENTFEWVESQTDAPTGWDPPPGFSTWKKARDSDSRRSRRRPRRSGEEREIMEEYLETGDEELAEEFSDIVTVPPEARRYSPGVEIRPQDAARREAAKKAGALLVLAKELRRRGEFKDYIDAQREIGELMGRHDLSEEEIRAYAERIQEQMG